MVAATAQATQIAASNPARISEKLTAKQLGILIGRTTLMAVCLLMMFAALHPETRVFVRTLLSNSEQRQVISTAQANLAGDSRVFTVAKVKAAGVLSLEIFENYGNGQQKLVEKIQLADSRDGYFDFNGHASNLALSDINNDGRPEILAPTFDNNLVGHLNIYGFDSESNAFQKIVR
jgi:hypothetical protein